MVEGKSMVEQSYELQMISQDVRFEGIQVDEQIQVSAIIDKLPESWKEFAKVLRHKQKELSIESFITCLRVEEEARNQDKAMELHGANGPKNCRFQKYGPMAQANVIEEPLVTMVTKINILEGLGGWWIDSGATKHVCYDKTSFKTYTILDEKKKIMLGDSHTIEVVGIGEVLLKFTSGREVTLKDVFHVPDIRKNLVSSFLLNKASLKQICEANQYVLSKKGMFVGKGYACDDMFKLNVEMRENSSLAYIVSCVNSRDVNEYEIEPRRSKRPRVEKVFGPEYYVYNLQGDPTSLEEALSSLDSGFWKKVINDEMDSIISNNTWKLVNLSPAIYNLMIHQMDVKTAFLNGDLEEAIYMDQPEGFTMSGNEHKVVEQYVGNLKKQQIIAKSTMKAKLIALSSASEETGWLRDLLSEIPMWEKPISPVLIHCDSTATIGKVRNKYYNGKSRSIRRKHSTVRSYINNDTINVDYISTNDNIANPLTKALAREKIWRASKGIGLKPKEE
ncbi:uncharacterized protein LOC142640016 [Castanea sativa]|uniref:uncharacterized protein LOC142640016 n=1 Tax=Castanea sativa TaxID=21020 RepID=UPI003F64A72C